MYVGVVRGKRLFWGKGKESIESWISSSPICFGVATRGALYTDQNRDFVPRFHSSTNLCLVLSIVPFFSPWPRLTMDNRRHRVHHYTPDPYGSQGPPQPGPYVPPDPYYAPQQHDQSFQPMGQPFQAGMNYMPTDYNVMFQSGNHYFCPLTIFRCKQWEIDHEIRQRQVLQHLLLSSKTWFQVTLQMHWKKDDRGLVTWLVFFPLFKVTQWAFLTWPLTFSIFLWYSWNTILRLTRLTCWRSYFYSFSLSPTK